MVMFGNVQCCEYFVFLLAFNFFKTLAADCQLIVQEGNTTDREIGFLNERKNWPSSTKQEVRVVVCQ